MNDDDDGPATAIMNTYQRLPVTFSHGDGAYLFDTQGKRYLDALCGISVTNLGHNYPAVTKAIKHQAESLLHTSNLYHIAPQQMLAQKLCSLAGMDSVFFANSGAEANEAAIKLARLHAFNQAKAAGAESNPLILTFSNSFHGRTLATLTATGNKKIKTGFGPLPEGFICTQYNDIQAAEQVFAEHGENIAGLLIEIVQGEGGIHPAVPEYLHQLQALCQQHNALFMVDEIQTGNGRCGSYFAYQALGLSPDVVTTAKGLGNGVPVGACLARGAAAKTLQPGTHGSTFGGNPLATAAALAVVNAIEDQQLSARAASLGEDMKSAFATSFADNAAVIDIRGMGLMMGIELDRPCGELVAQALEAGVLINVTADSVIRLLPPLILSDEEARQIVVTVCDLVNRFTQEKRTGTDG